MRYRPIQAASRERVPFTLWGHTRIRTVLAAVAASAAGLAPAIMISSPAMAAVNQISIGDATVTEGGDLVFTITREHDASNDLTSQVLNWSTANGTATAGSDYTAVSGGTVTLGAWTDRSNDQTATVTVHTTPDALAEAAETLTVTLTGSGADFADASATGTITDVPAFALTASSTTVTETARSRPRRRAARRRTRPVTIRATLTAAAGSDVHIPFHTSDGTAVFVRQREPGLHRGGSRVDRPAIPGSITIPAGDTSATKTVTINDDTLDEDASQYFDVIGGAGDNGSIALPGAGQVQINILDDDATPSVTIGDAGTAMEGSPLVFPLTLSGKSENAVTVKLSTVNGVDSGDTYGAVAGSDFTGLTNSTVTFPATTTSALAIVSTTDDSTVESSPEETLSAQLSSPTNATLGATTTGSGGINDNETAPTATITPTSFAEGNTGETSRTLTVTLGSPSTSSIPVKINYTFADGTATNGTDYRGTAGSVVIPPGSSTGTIPLTTIGDQVYEPGNETFNVVMSSPNASIANSGGGLTQAITITDDDFGADLDRRGHLGRGG